MRKDESSGICEELEQSIAEIEESPANLIVRHTSRRLGNLSPKEARELLISGGISFSEFVDQVGDDFRELLEFMTENDLHPGRPGEVLYCVESTPHLSDRRTLKSQLRNLYASEH